MIAVSAAVLAFRAFRPGGRHQIFDALRRLGKDQAFEATVDSGGVHALTAVFRGAGRFNGGASPGVCEVLDTRCNDA